MRQVKEEYKTVSIEQKLQRYLMLFCVYAFVGWIYEVFLWAKDYHMFVNRGFCFGPWLPIYGIGGLFILLLFEKREWHPLIKLLVISLFAMIVELISTYILDFIGIGFHALWNYDGDFMNFQGRVAPWPALKFGIIAMVVLTAQPYIDKAFNKKQVQYVMAVLSVLMIADIVIHLFIGTNYHYNF